MKVAYARIMLVGPGGVGKSSLLHGLMNLPLPVEACSTQVADTYTLRPTDTYWARAKCGGYWVKVTAKDEIHELVRLIQARNAIKKHRSVSRDFGSEAEIEKGKKFTHPQIKAIIDETIEATSAGDPSDASSSETSDSETIDFSLTSETSTIDTYLRVWDCGGQPVFLDILAAFLTARTLFLLMFDARHDLESPCVHRSHLRGIATEQVEEITTLQLMVQWMASIHATLLRKKSLENGGSCEEIDKFPQILPVGTHGDDDRVKRNKDDIFNPLNSACADKAFSHLLLNGIIVDNTTAGKGELEDATFQKSVKQPVNLPLKIWQFAHPSDGYFLGRFLKEILKRSQLYPLKK